MGEDERQGCGGRPNRTICKAEQAGWECVAACVRKLILVQAERRTLVDDKQLIFKDGTLIDSASPASPDWATRSSSGCGRTKPIDREVRQHCRYRAHNIDEARNAGSASVPRTVASQFIRPAAIADRGCSPSSRTPRVSIRFDLSDRSLLSRWQAGSVRMC